MENTPLNTKFFTPKKSIIIVTILFALLIVIVTPAVLDTIADSKPANTEPLHTASPKAESPIEPSKKTENISNRDQEAEDDEEDEYDYRKDLEKLAEETNRKAAQNRTADQSDSTGSPKQDNSNTTPPGNTGAKMDDTLVVVSDPPTKVNADPSLLPEPNSKPPLEDLRRYYFQVLHDFSSPPDIITYDSYTSETKLFENFQGNTLTAFQRTPAPDRARRYSAIMSYIDGKITGLMVDEYTGEFRKLSQFPKGGSLTPFARSPKKWQDLRFSMGFNFYDANIQCFVTDTYTSEIRMVSRTTIDESIHLFKKNIDPFNGTRRYLTWGVINSGELEIYGVDTFTSDVKRAHINDIKKEKSFHFFKPDKEDKGQLRYLAQCWFDSGSIVLMGLDTFNGEIVVRRIEEFNNSPVRLFKPNESKGYRRFSCWVNSLQSDYISIYILDGFTGEVVVIIRDHDKVEGSLGHFDNNMEEGFERYQGFPIIQIEGGVNFYIMDTFTSELRFRSHIEGEQTFNLFD